MRKAIIKPLSQQVTVKVQPRQYSVAVLGDPAADPAVAAEVARQWGSKACCCIPPGFTRALKQRQLSAADLSTSRWRTLLHFYGSTLNFTIADVEQTHAVNRLDAGSSFSTICAKIH